MANEKYTESWQQDPESELLLPPVGPGTRNSAKAVSGVQCCLLQYSGIVSKET